MLDTLFANSEEVLHKLIEIDVTNHVLDSVTFAGEQMKRVTELISKASR